MTSEEFVRSKFPDVIVKSYSYRKNWGGNKVTEYHLYKNKESTYVFAIGTKKGVWTVAKKFIQELGY